ncbi:MAG: 3-methyladenine DNA glycosylase [Phycisphaerae bacterium]|nr:3-methyladenine DNA glycosylase [Phycisphaerae bacterium]
MAGTVSNLPRLGPATFHRDAITLASDLLGCLLVRRYRGRTTSGIITETEAYPGGDDSASHSHAGHRSRRNESMYLPGGHCYVYLIYGMHHCVNIVSGPGDSGEAVLIRSLWPVDGIDLMRRRRERRRPLCAGPARLCQAMKIDRAQDGLDLIESACLYVLGRPEGFSDSVLRGPRIGIDPAGSHAMRPWRMVLGGYRTRVSVAIPGAPLPRPLAP